MNGYFCPTSGEILVGCRIQSCKAETEMLLFRAWKYPSILPTNYVEPYFPFPASVAQFSLDSALSLGCFLRSKPHHAR